MYKIDDKRLIHDNLEDIRRFPLDNRDLIISGFPRSGTNWLQVMFTNLWDDWTTTKNPLKRVPGLSGPGGNDYEGYPSCISSDPPRLMKCHLPVDLMPIRWPHHGKVVHITRNPKDVLVSYFHLFKKLGTVAAGTPHEVIDFGEHLDRFIRGEVLYGPYLESVIGWREFDHPNLLKITYEDALSDTESFLRQVIAFVGKPVDETRLEEVVATTEFNAMKTSNIRFQINAPTSLGDENTPFLRSGKVGGWKTALSVADNETIDRELVKPLEEHGVFLRYE